MTQELNNNISIDKNKLLPFKNKMEVITNELNEQYKQKIKSDCQTLTNAFLNIINNKLPTYKPQYGTVNTINSDSFNLNVIFNFRQFENNCAYNIDTIEKDLSEVIGFRSYFHIEYPHLYSVNNEYKLKLNITSNKI